MKTIEELEAELREAEAEYRAAQYRLDEGDGSFSRMLEARERLYNALQNKQEPNE